MSPILFYENTIPTLHTPIGWNHMLNTLRCKPLMCFCLVYLIGSCVSIYIPSLPKLICAGLFLLAAILVIAFGNKILRKIYDFRRIRVLLAVLFFIASAVCVSSFLTFNHYAEQFSEKAGAEDSVTLEITEVVYTSSFGARYYAKVSQSEIFQSPFRLALDTADPSLIPGDRLTGTVAYKVLKEDLGGYNEQRYALSQKVVIGCDAVDLSYLDHNDSFSLPYFFAELNQKLCRHLYRHTGEESGGLAAALLLGSREELSDSLKRDFRRLGLIHMLCLSGAHLSILTTLSERILLKLKIGKKKRAVFNIAAVTLFMALTGFSPSLTRAGIMLILANIAFLVNCTPDYPTSLTFACALILAANPFSALDYGLHLSFLAAHSCYISSTVSHRVTSFLTIKKRSRFRKARKICNRIIRSITETTIYNLIISINILPLIFLYFGEMSLVSLPANLIYVPLITLLMYITILFYLLSPFLIFSAPLAEVISAISAFISSTAQSFSSLRNIVLPLNYGFTPFFIIPLILLSAAAFSGQKKVIRTASSISICVFALFLGTVGLYSANQRNHVIAEYVTQGKNDGFLVRSENRLLIAEVSDASYTFASLLTSHRLDMNCSEIEAYMLTHYHKKHVAALSKLTDCCILRTLILPYPITETDAEVYNALQALAKEKNIQTVITDRQYGDTVYFNEMEIETYPFTYLSRSDHPVVAIRLSCGENEIMYLGGSFNEGDAIISRHAENADILIFGGHSPVYKTVFDPDIAASKTVYISEDAEESLSKLSPDLTRSLKEEKRFTPGIPLRLQ